MPPTTESNDGIAGLQKMSTTAGLGDDYASVDPLAVVAGVLAVLSLSALLIDWLVVLPVLGLVVAAVAAVRIRAGGGTRTGLSLAIGAGLACLVLTGIAGATLLTTSATERADIAAMEQAVADLEAGLKSGDVDAAYAGMHLGFRAAVPPERFADLFSRLAETRGPLAAIETSGRYLIERSTDADVPDLATTQLLLFHGENLQPRRVPVIFLSTDAGWSIRTLQELFPEAGGGDVVEDVEHGNDGF